MSSSPPDEPPYGERFSKAWAQLQRYLGDLDQNELAKMAKLDFEGTLKLLQEQPALGHSGALNKAKGKKPEELAAAILAQRLAALTQDYGSGDDSPWGARFLKAWRSCGGGIAHFRYAMIQELKKADKEESIELLSKKWGRSQGIRGLLENGSPEDAARRVMARWYANSAMFIAAVL